MPLVFRRTIVALLAGFAALVIAAYAWIPESASRPAADAQAASLPDNWIIQPEIARQLISGGALVLDTRDPLLALVQPLPGAVPVQWQAFSQADAPSRGLLLDDDDALSQRLQAIGVSADRPVVVIADNSRGWGEDGRIVWMLHTLGHEKTYMVDGGINALLASGSITIPTVAGAGDFVVNRNERWLTTIETVRDRLDTEDGVFVDVREPREFAGAVPYGETRGGHLPGAKHVYYRELLGANGRLLPETQVRALLASRGITDDVEVIAYCTGGVRSAWFTAVLHDLGYQVRTYAGSMWEWSAAEADSHPLSTEIASRPAS